MCFVFPGICWRVWPPDRLQCSTLTLIGGTTSTSSATEDRVAYRQTRKQIDNPEFAKMERARRTCMKLYIVVECTTCWSGVAKQNVCVFVGSKVVNYVYEISKERRIGAIRQVFYAKRST